MITDILFRLFGWAAVLFIFLFVGSFLIQFELIGAMVLGVLIALAMILGAD